MDASENSTKITILCPAGLISSRVSFAKPDSRAKASVSRSFTDIVWRRLSQMRAVSSSDAVTMREPSGLKAAEVTVHELEHHSDFFTTQQLTGKQFFHDPVVKF